MPTFFRDREECLDDFFYPAPTSDDETHPIELLAFIGREYHDDPEMVSVMAKVLGIEAPAGGAR